jgi:hypothetical protein
MKKPEQHDLKAVIADLYLIEAYALDRDDVNTLLKSKRILDNIAAVARQALGKLGEPRLENFGKKDSRNRKTR